LNDQDLSRLSDEELAKLAGIRLIKYPKDSRVDARGVVYDLGEKEPEFQKWYQDWAKKTGIAADPDPDLHLYDYRLAFLAGEKPGISPQDNQWHWPSQFKYRAELQGIDHPNRYVDGIDTTKYQEDLADETQAVAETDKLPEFTKLSDAELEALAEKAGITVTKRPGQLWREFVWTPAGATPTDIYGGLAAKMFVRSFVRGLGSMFQLTGAFIESQANLPPEGAKLADNLKTVGDKLSAAEDVPATPEEQKTKEVVAKSNIGTTFKHFGESIERATAPDFQTQWQGLKSAFDPVYLMEAGGSQLGLQAPSLALSSIAAAAGTSAGVPPSVTSLMIGVINRLQESAMEGGDAYDSAIQKGKTPQEAAVIADKVFKNNMILTGSDFGQALLALVSAGKISKQQSNAIVKLLKFAGVAVVEGGWQAGEEGVQAVIQQSARGDKVAFNDEMKEGMFWGFSMGGLFSGFAQMGEIMGEKIRAAHEDYVKDLQAKKAQPATALPPEAPPIAVPSPEPAAQVGIPIASVSEPQIPTAPDIDLSDALNEEDFKTRADNAASSFRGVPQSHANTVLIKAPNALGLAAAVRTSIVRLFNTLKRDPFGFSSRNISAMGNYALSADGAWFTDKQLYVKGEPPKWARPSRTLSAPTAEAIATISKMTGEPAVPVYYLNMQGGFYLVSKDPLPAYRPETPAARKVAAPNVVIFRTMHDGKVYFTGYEQFRVQGIKRMFPDAEFSVAITNTAHPALLAKVNGELKAVLLPYRTSRGAPAVYSPAPLDTLVRMAGINPDVDSTTIYTLPPAEKKGGKKTKAKKGTEPTTAAEPTTEPTAAAAIPQAPEPQTEPAPRVEPIEISAEPEPETKPEPGTEPVPPETGAPPEPSSPATPPEVKTVAPGLNDRRALFQSLSHDLMQYMVKEMPAMPVRPMLDVLERIMFSPAFKEGTSTSRMGQLYAVIRFGRDIDEMAGLLTSAPLDIKDEIRSYLKSIFQLLPEFFAEEQRENGPLEKLTPKEIEYLYDKLGLRDEAVINLGLAYEGAQASRFESYLGSLRNGFLSMTEWLGPARWPLVDLNKKILNGLQERFDANIKKIERESMPDFSVTVNQVKPAADRNGTIANLTNSTEDSDEIPPTTAKAMAVDGAVFLMLNPYGGPMTIGHKMKPWISFLRYFIRRKLLSKLYPQITLKDMISPDPEDQAQGNVGWATDGHIAFKLHDNIKFTYENYKKEIKQKSIVGLVERMKPEHELELVGWVGRLRDEDFWTISKNPFHYAWQATILETNVPKQFALFKIKSTGQPFVMRADFVIPFLRAYGEEPLRFYTAADGEGMTIRQKVRGGKEEPIAIMMGAKYEIRDWNGLPVSIRAYNQAYPNDQIDIEPQIPVSGKEIAPPAEEGKPAAEPTTKKKRVKKRTPAEEADFERVMSSRDHPTPPTIGAMEVAEFYGLDWDKLDDAEHAAVIEYVENGQVILPDEFMSRISLDRYKQEKAGKGTTVWKTGKKFGDIIAGGLESMGRLILDPSKVQGYLIDFARSLGCTDFSINARMEANGAFVYGLLTGGAQIMLGTINSVATFAHEVGHAFDILQIGRGKSLNTLCERAGIPYRTEMEAGFLAELKEVTSFFREITPELIQAQPDYVRNYRWTPVELFAMWFAANALHPEAVEQLAPNFTDAMRNRFPQLQDVTAKLQIKPEDLSPNPVYEFFDPFVEAAARVTHLVPLPGEAGKSGRRLWATKIRRAATNTFLLPQWSGLFMKNPAGRKIFRAVQDNLIYFYNGALAGALENLNLRELHSLPRDSKNKIAHALDHGNRQEVQKYLSADQLRTNFGLAPQEIEVYQRIVDAINASKERIRERLRLQSDYYRSDEPTKQAIDARIDEALEKLGGYFPIERHGPWIVWATKEEMSPGEVALIEPRAGLGVAHESFYSAFTSVTEANKVAELIRKMGYKDAQVYRRETLPPGFWDRFHRMSTWDLENLVEQAGADRGDPNVQMMIKLLKMRSPLDKHFMQRRWVPGYKVDFDDMMLSLESFVEATTRRLASARARYQANPWIAQIDVKKNPEASIYYNHFLENSIYGSSKDFVHVRQGISLATLALSATFALQQVLQNVFTLWPYIGNHVGKQFMDFVYSKSMMDAFRYLATRVKGQHATIDPTLAMLLDKAITEKVVSGQYMQSLLGPGRDRARNILDALHFVAIGTEFWNKLHAACAGYILATRFDKLTSPLDIYESMKDAVEYSTYTYGKTNIPELVAQAGSVRGLVKVAYLFKATHLNYLHEFADIMARGTPKAKIRMMTSRALFLGVKRLVPMGVLMWPLVRAVARALFKKDPEYELMKGRASENPMAEAMAQFLSYGVGGWAKLDLTDMLDLGTIMSPGFDPLGQLAGPAYGMGERLATAQKLIQRKRFAEAFAQIPIRPLSNYLTAELWRKEGKEVQKDLYIKFTDAEIRGKRLGFTPARLKEQYEIRNMQKQIVGRYEDLQQRAYGEIRRNMDTTEGRLLLMAAARGDVPALYKALGDPLIKRIARHNAEVHEALTIAYMTSASPIPESVAMKNYKQYTISPADTLRWVQDEIKGKVRFENLPEK